MNRAYLLLTLLLVASLTACSSSRDRSGFDPDDPLGSYRAELSAAQMYEEARREMDRGNFREAAEQLQNLQARYPFGAYFQQAQLDIIYAFYRANEMGSTIRAADRYMRLNPQDEHVAYALYMRARANLERGDDLLTRTFGIDRRTRDSAPLKESLGDFIDLVERFPDSQYAEDAQERIVFLRNGLAYHELHVARFYMKRKAHVAAANRAMGIIENYQGTGSVMEALEILAESYEYLGLSDLREDVLRVIQENDPDHKLL